MINIIKATMRGSLCSKWFAQFGFLPPFEVREHNYRIGVESADKECVSSVFDEMVKWNIRLKGSVFYILLPDEKRPCPLTKDNLIVPCEGGTKQLIAHPFENIRVDSIYPLNQHHFEKKPPERYSIEDSAALKDTVRDMKKKLVSFTRNGRWGTCTDCPTAGDGTVLPELCINTSRSDHLLSASSLAEAFDTTYNQRLLEQ